MFVDFASHGGSGGSWERWCSSCKLLIGDDEATHEINFGSIAEDSLGSLNGVYHERCARPLLTVKRALDALNRFSG